MASGVARRSAQAPTSPVELWSSATGRTSWRREPLPAMRFDGTSALAIAGTADELCIASQSLKKIRILCRAPSDSSWSSAGGTAELEGRLVGLIRSGSGLIGATVVGRSLRTFTVRSGRVLVEPGDTPLKGSIAVLSEGDRGPLLTVKAVGARAPVYVSRRASGRWASVGPPLTDAGIGPQPGGAVEHDGVVYLGTTHAVGNQWPFRVAILRGGRWTIGRRLNPPGTSGQGQVALSTDGAIAVWQSQSAWRDGTFTSEAAVRGLSPSGPTAMRFRLWKRRTIGPGATVAVPWHGGVLVVTSAADPRNVRDGLKARVDLIIPG